MLKKILFTIAGIFLTTVIILIFNKHTTISLPEYIDRMPQVSLRGETIDEVPVWQEAIEESSNAKYVIIKDICIGIVMTIIISAVLFTIKIYEIDVTSICCMASLLIIPYLITILVLIKYIEDNITVVV